MVHGLLHSSKRLRISRDFAANIGLAYHTPEEYFLHEEPRPFTRDFDPTSYINDLASVEEPISACMFGVFSHLRNTHSTTEV